MASPSDHPHEAGGEPAPRAGWALVTGASGGIGGEISKELARRGWGLILTARSEETLRTLAEGLREGEGVPVRVVPADLADHRAPALLEAATEGQGLPVELLVNNAGFGGFGRFLESEPERALGMIQVNAAAVTALSHRFGNAMAKRGRGRILNVASTASFQPGPGRAVYYATKAYVHSLSEALRVEFRGAGISVTTLCPGPTATGFQEEAAMGDPGLSRIIPVPEADEVARFGVDAVLAGKGLVIHGRVNRLAALVVRFTPRRWLPELVHRIQRARS